MGVGFGRGCKNRSTGPVLGFGDGVGLGVGGGGNGTPVAAEVGAAAGAACGDGDGDEACATLAARGAGIACVACIESTNAASVTSDAIAC